MRRKFISLWLLCTLLSSGYAFAIEQDPHPFSVSADANRFLQLTKEIRCVVCQNQNIADSNAPLANDLREKVYRMVLERQSDAEIKAYLVKRYGEFILLEPRFNKNTWILWGFPFLAVVVVLGFLGRRILTRAR